MDQLSPEPRAMTNRPTLGGLHRKPAILVSAPRPSRLWRIGFAGWSTRGTDRSAAPVATGIAALCQLPEKAERSLELADAVQKRHDAGPLDALDCLRQRELQ